MWRAEEGKMKEEHDSTQHSPKTTQKFFPLSLFALSCLSLAVPTSLPRGFVGGFVRFYLVL